MKEIKEEVKSYNIKYEAIDGTIFYNKEECEKYEQSAKAVLRAKFKKLVLVENTEYTLFNVGQDDNLVYAVKMSQIKDADTVKQLYIADNEWLTKNEDYQRYIDRAFNIIDKAYKENDVLLVGENCDNEIFIIATRNTTIETLNSLDKQNEEK